MLKVLQVKNIKTYDKARLPHQHIHQTRNYSIVFESGREMGSPIYMFIPITPISVLINFLNFTSVFFVLPKSRAGGGGGGTPCSFNFLL